MRKLGLGGTHPLTQRYNYNLSIEMNKETKLLNILLLLALCVSLFLGGVFLGGKGAYSFNFRDFVMPTIAVFAALLAATMAHRTLQNAKRAEVLKNTLDALNHDLFKGDSRVRFENACIKLSAKIDEHGSFKALVRLRPAADKFVEQYKTECPKDYEQILDALNYINRLCFGAGAGIYDQKLVNEFLGEALFQTWWAGMIIIREKEMRYIERIHSSHKLHPDFGSPYKYLYKWVQSVKNSQNIEGLDYVFAKLDEGFERRATTEKIAQRYRSYNKQFKSDS
ncbi:DUF4760 domain-containing protein [Vibrio vulnificus]|uniref:DUF4760 domain-containing protein n=1 Tax=Vibrio vulnificus TaxID=672 RepID=UPI0009CCCBC1|nr:putative membrane protein [Vibrio vulnificus]